MTPEAKVELLLLVLMLAALAVILWDFSAPLRRRWPAIIHVARGRHYVSDSVFNSVGMVIVGDKEVIISNCEFYNVPDAAISIFPSA